MSYIGTAIHAGAADSSTRITRVGLRRKRIHKPPECAKDRLDLLADTRLAIRWDVDLSHQRLDDRRPWRNSLDLNCRGRTGCRLRSYDAVGLHGSARCAACRQRFHWMCLLIRWLRI